MIVAAAIAAMASTSAAYPAFLRQMLSRVRKSIFAFERDAPHVAQLRQQVDCGVH